MQRMPREEAAAATATYRGLGGEEAAAPGRSAQASLVTALVEVVEGARDLFKAQVARSGRKLAVGVALGVSSLLFAATGFAFLVFAAYDVFLYAFAAEAFVGGDLLGLALAKLATALLMVVLTVALMQVARKVFARRPGEP